MKRFTLFFVLLFATAKMCRQVLPGFSDIELRMTLSSCARAGNS